MKQQFETLFNWPNIVTFIRLAVIPLFVIVFYLPFSWAHTVAAIIFMVASLSDWLDGYLARSLKQVTKLGAFLDPVADKLIVSIALVLIVAESQFQFIGISSTVVTVPAALITIPAAIIVAREIIVSALREWMAELGKRASVAVSYLGKVKTFVQMLALTILLYCSGTTNTLIVVLGYLLLYASAVLTIWTMLIYLRASYRALCS
jgi:CDP-diacylglycerol---glycerol-3-phosphate 3-phosphatidyltransferase